MKINFNWCLRELRQERRSKSSVSPVKSPILIQRRSQNHPNFSEPLMRIPVYQELQVASTRSGMMKISCVRVRGERRSTHPLTASLPTMIRNLPTSTVKSCHQLKEIKNCQKSLCQSHPNIHQRCSVVHQMKGNHRGKMNLINNSILMICLLTTIPIRTAMPAKRSFSMTSNTLKSILILFHREELLRRLRHNSVSRISGRRLNKKNILQNWPDKTRR